MGAERTGGGGQPKALGRGSEGESPAGGAAARSCAHVARRLDPSLHWISGCPTGPGEWGSGGSAPKTTAGEGDYSGVQAGGGAVTRPFSSNLPLFCAQGKTYSFSLGNFAWDGFLAVAPQGRSGEKRFHSNAGAAVGALLVVSPPRGGHPGKWEEDRPRIESAWASCALTGWDRGGVGRGRLGLQREQTPLMVGVGGGGKGPGEIISGLETGCQGKVKDPVKT